MQNFHCRPSPPQVGIKDEYVCISPMPSVLFNCLDSDSSIWYSVVQWIVRV